MTKLTMAIRREVDLYGVGPVVVGLEPTTKSFVFREKGCRTEYCIPILTVFVLAIKANEKGGKNGRKESTAAKVPRSTKTGRGTKSVTGPDDRRMF